MEHFLQANQIDIACITETHLNPTSSFVLQGYKTVRVDRQNSNGGGVLILIKYTIPHNQITLPHTPGLEKVAINLNYKNNDTLTIVTVYKPPNIKINNSNISALFQLTNPFIIVGDLNSKHTTWGCRTTNPAGNYIYDIKCNLNLRIISPIEPTYFPYDSKKSPDILDIAITNIKAPFTSSTHHELDSDHIPVIISTRITKPPTSPTPTLNTYNIKWNHFKNTIRNCIPPFRILNSPQEINQAITTLNNIIISTINNNNIEKTLDINKKFQKPLPSNIIELIKTKNKTRRLWNSLRIPALKKELNHLNNICKKALNSYKQEQYSTYIRSLNTKNNSLWQFTKKLLKKKNVIPPLATNNGKKYSPLEKAEELASHFADSFSPNSSPYDPKHDEIYRTFNAPLYNVPHKINFISPYEIKNIIQNMPNKKAPGHDRINTIILKNLPDNAIAFLNNIYNSILRTGHFPEIWKHSIVHPIPKPNKNHSRAENYRPISLLPVMTKILEKLILTRLNKYTKKTKVIPPHQFGFISQYSTTHQLLRLTEHIHTAFQKGQHTITAFIDISQAFDRIWHPALYYKLVSIGTPKYLIQVIKSFICNRTFSVSVDGHYSNPRTITAGVPQGSPLSPALFNLYTADIPISPQINTAQFADDTALYSSGTSLPLLQTQLQNHLNLLTNWANIWKIKLNPTKSVAKVFTLKPFVTPLPLTINNNIINWTPTNRTIKYLGLNFDTRLNWKQHINIKTQQAKIKLIQLRPLLNKHSQLSIHNAILIYKSIIRPTLLYACPIWTNAANTNLNRIQVLQNKFLRLITKAPWYISNKQLHNDLEINTITNQIAYISHTFYTNLPLIQASIHYKLGKSPNYQTRIKNRYPLHSFYKIFANVE